MLDVDTPALKLTQVLEHIIVKNGCSHLIGLPERLDVGKQK